MHIRSDLSYHIGLWFALCKLDAAASLKGLLPPPHVWPLAQNVRVILDSRRNLNIYSTRYLCIIVAAMKLQYLHEG